MRREDRRRCSEVDIVRCREDGTPVIGVQAIFLCCPNGSRASVIWALYSRFKPRRAAGNAAAPRPSRNNRPQGAGTAQRSADSTRAPARSRSATSKSRPVRGVRSAALLPAGSSSGRARVPELASLQDGAGRGAGLSGQLNADRLARCRPGAGFFESDAVTKTRKGRAKAKPTVDKTRRVLRLALEWAAARKLIEAAPWRTRTTPSTS